MSFNFNEHEVQLDPTENRQIFIIVSSTDTQELAYLGERLNSFAMGLSLQGHAAFVMYPQKPQPVVCGKCGHVQI